MRREGRGAHYDARTGRSNPRGIAVYVGVIITLLLGTVLALRR